MVEVFITDIRNPSQAAGVLHMLENSFPGLQINFDLDNPEPDFPCRHNILRVQGTAISATLIATAVQESGFRCEVLQDKTCNQL